MSEVVAVIPVRFGAQRFPGKPLAPILGKPMIEWVIEGVSQSQKINRICIATDDERIAKVCRRLDVSVIMTDSELPSGTDRVYQAIKSEPEDLIINVQGDEPLIKGAVIDEMVDAMKNNSDWDLLTLAQPLDVEDLENLNVAKIVVNHRSEAIYFSRFPVPYSRHKKFSGPPACLKHIGLYGYRKSFLKKFCETEPADIELAEGLEQLRALYLGAQVYVHRLDEFESCGVDVPADVEKVEIKLKERHG